MGLFSSLFGNVSEIDSGKIEEEFGTILVQGEGIEKAYRLVRDLVVFTNKRLVMVDKQGFSGKKKQYTSIPYRSIVRFSKESQGHFDMDAEIKIWLSGTDMPLSIEFQKDKNIHDVYQVLSAQVLG